MTSLSPQPGTWNVVLRRITDPAEQKALSGKSVGVIVVSALLAAGGLALGISGISWSGWILAVLGLLSIGIWALVAANSRAAAKWTGDDLIEVIVADEGVVGQGGLAIPWSEVSDIRYEWSRPVMTGTPAALIGGAAASAAFDAVGLDTSLKAIQIRLKDFKAVKERTTSKVQRLALFGPMLGDPGYLHVGQYGRSTESMRELLTVLADQAARNNVPMVRRDPS